MNHWQTIEGALDKAEQLANIASDWNLDEVEINGEMVDIYDLRQEFETALAFVREKKRAKVWRPVAWVDPDAPDGFFGVITLEFTVDENGRYVCEDMAEELALCELVDE